MKKSKLLISLMMLLVAACGYAQDSYREAVKDYLTAFDQFEKSKSLIPSMNLLFEKNDKVDIDQLTNQYLEERFENDVIDWFESYVKSYDMTEADLKELASLFASPEGKTYLDHQEEWMGKFFTNLMMPFVNAAKEGFVPEDMDMDADFDEEFETKVTAHMLGEPVQPNEEIDAAYAAKFNDVIWKSDNAKKIMDVMMQRFEESTDSIYERKETRQLYKDWMMASVPAIVLNSAYGTLTLEDLDFVAKLFDNEAYGKFLDINNTDNEILKTGHFMTKYAEWMKEHGATVSQEPSSAFEFFKSILKAANIDADEYFNTFFSKQHDE